MKPPKPDEESFKGKLDAVTEQIDKRKEEMKKLTQKIEERSQGIIFYNFSDEIFFFLTGMLNIYFFSTFVFLQGIPSFQNIPP